MKPFTLLLTAFLVCSLYPPSCNAQDLSELFPVAHYTLINTTEDALGLQLPVNLVNSPFSGDQGVYCNGQYLNGDPDSSLVETPLISALYDSVFAVQVEFKCIDLHEKIRPVFVCGDSYRYLGFMTYTDSTFRVMYNNGYNHPIPDIQAVENNWYEVTLIHHTLSALTECYLDGEKVVEFNDTLDRDQNDSRISNTNFGSGRTFKGYLRNLIVYGSEETSALPELARPVQLPQLIPNPTTGNLYFEAVDSRLSYWRITNMDGIVLKSGVVTQGSNEMETHDLIPGMYVVYFFDMDKKPVGSEKFVKGEGKYK